MPLVRAMPISEQVSNINGLPDEMRDKIFTNFTLSELMIFESVSTQWQGSVNRVIKGFKLVAFLSVVFRGRQIGNNEISCGHQFSRSSIIVYDPEYRKPVIRLIAKMTNLVAIGLPSYLPSEFLESLIAALEKSTKLEHLAYHLWPETSGETTIPKTLRPRVTCLSARRGLPQAIVTNQMTSLKHFRYNPDGMDLIPLDLLITLLNNGLVGLETTMYYEHFGTLCKLGSRLESLDVEFFTTLYSNDIRQLVQTIPKLRKLNVDMSIRSLSLLKDLKNLQDLMVCRVTLQQAQLFKAAIGVIGRRLKSLRFDSIYSNQVIADVAVACSNLESLSVGFNYDQPSPPLMLASFLKLTKLRYLHFRFLHWTTDQILELLYGLRNLSKIEGRMMMSNDELANFKSLVKLKLLMTDIHVNI